MAICRIDAWLALGGNAGGAPAAAAAHGAAEGRPHVPLMPPGADPPSLFKRAGRAAGLAPPSLAPGPRAASAPLIGDYREAYRSLVAGLAGGGRSPVPPGHPLYSRAESAAALRAENDALRKEIADLKSERSAALESPEGGPAAAGIHPGGAP